MVPSLYVLYAFVLRLELGLNRKAAKSAQAAIDLVGKQCGPTTVGWAHLRAHIIKGKALSASNKSAEADQAWNDGLSAAIRTEHLADTSLLLELHSLVQVRDATSMRIMPTSNTNPEPQPSPSRVPFGKAPTEGTALSSKSPATCATSTDTGSASPQASVGKKIEATNESPKKQIVGAPLRQPVSAQPAAIPVAANALRAQGASSSPPPPPPRQEQVTGEAALKESYRKALVAVHQRSVGEGHNMVKPLLLTAMRQNLPHICGEPLVDDLVCLAYIHVNGGNLETASSIFKVIADYRKDVPAAMIGAGSVAAMQRNFDLAIKEFSAALVVDDKIADAWKRRGQTRAAKGQVRTAIKDLSRALALQPDDGDTYNQRGLVYHQTRNYTRALADFRAARAKGVETAALWNYIGMCEGQLGHVVPSLQAHEKALRLQSPFKEAQLNIALMHKEVGSWVAAEAAFAKAIKSESQTFFQAYAHRGLMHMQMGKPALAIKDVTVAINALFTIVKGTGGAAVPVEERQARRNELVQNLVRAGVCYQTVGQYNKTVAYCDQAVSLAPSSYCLFQREVALFLWAHLDVDLTQYNIDDRVDPRLKDGWCKHADWAEYMTPHLAQATQGASAAVKTSVYTPATKPTHVPCTSRCTSVPADDDSGLLPPLDLQGKGSQETAGSTPVFKGVRCEAEKLRLVALTAPFSRLIQLDSPGFLPNRRQHRMFGLAVLQATTALCRHLTLVAHESSGLSVPDSACSRSSARQAIIAGRFARAITSPGAEHDARKLIGAEKTVHSRGPSLHQEAYDRSPSGKRGTEMATHTFNWRDLFDIAVRWRQVSEPGDPVWWIDRFPTRAFAEGFGLQTPLVNGHLTTVRYATYYQPAFDRVKDILQQHGFYTAADAHHTLDTEGRERIAAAVSLRDLQVAVGCDFYVVVPCPSLFRSGVVHEGTRLTLLAQEPEGFDFTIRTPGTSICCASSLLCVA
jgi:tetratricopeptide (TPR) repeat protein